MLETQSDGPNFAAIWQKACFHQIKRTRRALDGKVAAGTAHHQARSGLKRTRALLLLGQKTLGKRKARQLDQRLATIARALSETRDLEAMLEELNRCAQARLPESHATSLLHLKTAISAEQSRRPAATNLIDASPSFLPDLAAIRKEFKAVRPNAPSIGDAAKCAAKTYRKARTAMRTALRTSTAEELHDWRKLGQRHLRQLEIFAAAGHPTLGDRIETLRRIVQSLGEDHDLSLLMSYTASTAVDGLDQTMTAETLAFFAERQRKHRATLRPLASTVFELRREDMRQLLHTSPAAAEINLAAALDHARTARLTRPEKAVVLPFRPKRIRKSRT